MKTTSACKALALTLLACAAACDGSASVYWRRECLIESAERRAKFVLDCATAANPHSDEEGEDLVSQCESTAAALFCSSVPVACRSGEVCVPCAEATDPKRLAACAMALPENP